MQLKDSNIKVTGSLTIKKYNSNNELTQELHVPNLIVKTGKQYIMNRMVGNSPNVINIMAIGTNGTIPGSADTALIDKIAESEVDAPVTSNEDVTIEYSALFDGNTRSGNIVEAALFSAASTVKTFNGATAVAITSESTVNDGDLVIGQSYTILNVGSTSDFTTVGASANTNGVSFIATGTDAGGDGTVTPKYATITLTSHGLSTGEMIKYSDGTASGNSPIGTLSEGGYYYVIKLTDNTFRLAASYANAVAVTPIPIGTSTGVGTHSVEKFTYSSGTTMLCRSTFPVVTKAAGETISINWVVRIG